MQKTINKLKTLAQIESDCLLRLKVSFHLACLLLKRPFANNVVVFFVHSNMNIIFYFVFYSMAR